MIEKRLVDGSATADLRLTVPSDWSERDLGGAELAVVAPVHLDHFTPNVVVSLTELPAGADPLVAVAALREARDGLQDVALLGEGSFDLRGTGWFITEYAYRDPEAGTVLQSVRLSLTEGGGLLRLTATVSGDSAAEDLPLVREVMDSVQW